MIYDERARRTVDTLTRITCNAAVFSAVALSHVGTAAADPPLQTAHLDRTAIEMGGHYEKQECLALPYSVWINVQNTDFCVRYYIALGTTKPRDAIIYFQGDEGQADGSKIRLSPDWHSQDPSKLQNFADGMQQYTGATSIYFGRMGLSGSSGSHGLRRTPLEVDFTDRALDVIKEKHGFNRIHLVGQSGGTRVILGIMAHRNDIGCVALGAGMLLMPPDVRARNMNSVAPYREFDVEESLDRIAAHSNGRIFVISDPQDVYSPVKDQVQFVNLMRPRGAKIAQIFVHAADREHHDVISFSMGTIYDCVNGLPTEAIIRRRR
jgi:hypothetical protein